MSELMNAYYRKKILMHSNQNHKYIARVKTANNNRWRYFYSQKEYEAYLRRSHENDPITETVETEYDSNGAVVNSRRTRYNSNGASYTNQRFTGSNKKEVTTGELVDKGSGVYSTRETRQTYIHEGRNFIENLFNLPSDYWKKSGLPHTRSSEATVGTPL